MDALSPKPKYGELIPPVAISDLWPGLGLADLHHDDHLFVDLLDEKDVDGDEGSVEDLIDEDMPVTDAGPEKR